MNDQWSGKTLLSAVRAKLAPPMRSSTQRARRRISTAPPSSSPSAPALALAASSAPALALAASSAPALAASSAAVPEAGADGVGEVVGRHQEALAVDLEGE